MNTEHNLSDKQISLIAHSLGIRWRDAQLSDDPKYKYLPDEFYRNYYCVGEQYQFNDDMIELKSLKLIDTWNRDAQLFFCITKNGIELFRNIFAREITLKYVPLSKSKERYRQYLHDDISDSFSDSLRICLPMREYNKGLVRFRSTKYDCVIGEYCRTLKEAKISYKEKLVTFKKELKETRKFTYQF